MADYDANLRLYLETDADLHAQSPGKLDDLGIRDMEMERRIRRFVLAEGERFDPHPLPPGLTKRQSGWCFVESLRLSIENTMIYVEGYALSRLGEIAHHHAWCEDADGNVVDCTWGDDGRAYFGIRFRHEYVSARWERKEFGGRVPSHYSLLNDHSNGLAILNGKQDDWKQMIAQNRPGTHRRDRGGSDTLPGSVR